MSEENLETVRRIYETFADGFNEETVRTAIASGLVNPAVEVDLRTAYPDGPVVRFATLSDFLDTQPWGRSIRSSRSPSETLAPIECWCSCDFEGSAREAGSRWKLPSRTW